MDKQFVTKDSGERQAFATGSVRDLPKGKGRFDLVPTMPLRRLAGLYERGAEKYGDRNWQKGQPLMRYVDSAMRHLNCLVAGEPEEDHAAAVAWNMFGFMYTVGEIEAGRLPKSLDDRPPPEPQYLPKPAPAKPEPAKPEPAKPEPVKASGSMDIDLSSWEDLKKALAAPLPKLAAGWEPVPRDELSPSMRASVDMMKRDFGISVEVARPVRPAGDK